MVTGIDDAMILPQQFLPVIFRNGAKLVVDVGDFALRIGDGDDGVLVQRRLQIADLLERGLQLFLRPLALRNVGPPRIDEVCRLD